MMDAHHETEVQNPDVSEQLDAEHKLELPSDPPVLALPAMSSRLDLDLDLTAILAHTPEETERVEKVKKRQSNVMKLSEENEKLKAQLKAMSDRLEAAERKREELTKQNEPRIASAPSVSS